MSHLSTIRHALGACRSAIHFAYYTEMAAQQHPCNTPEQCALIDRILHEFKPATIVETGTYIGTSTAHFIRFAEHVISIESHWHRYSFAKLRLEHLPIDLIHGRSELELYELGMVTRPVLYYLDAHEVGRSPAQEEIANIVGNDVVIIIDDYPDTLFFPRPIVPPLGFTLHQMPGFAVIKPADLRLETIDGRS